MKHSVDVQTGYLVHFEMSKDEWLKLVQDIAMRDCDPNDTVMIPLLINASTFDQKPILYKVVSNADPTLSQFHESKEETDEKS